MDTKSADAGTIRRFLDLILFPGAVAEVRVPRGRQQVESGYFDTLEPLAEAAGRLSGSAAGVFVTLNPGQPALLARADNRMKPRAEHTTQDRDILGYRWFLVDVDSRRPAGVSATDLEHEAALLVVEEIAGALSGLGFPKDSMVVADSGNGAHILVRVDLPNSPDSEALLKNCLAALDFRFSDDMVSIDQCTANPARLVKVCGTLAAKGDNTAERPHRMTRIIAMPSEPVPAPRDALETLGSMVPAKPADGRKSGHSMRMDLESWLTEKAIDVKQWKDWQGGRLAMLSVCPWNADHTGGVAYAIQFSDGAIAAGCHHNSCAGKGWQDLKAQYGGAPCSAGPAGGDDEGGAARKKSQSSQLLELVADTEFFHAPDGRGYATVATGGHLETWELNSRGFRRWLSRLFYQKTGRAPSRSCLTDALSVLDGRAQYDGPETAVSSRLAQYGEAIYLDLGDPEWRAVEITPSGWKVVASCPVRFRRTAGMLALPDPVPGGKVEELRRFLNVGSDADWVRVACWLVQALRPTGPYPVLALVGEGGSTKSTAARVLRSLVDPNSAPLRSGPQGIRDLMIAASNAWMLILDNLSQLTPWLSDGLCRLATGGGFSTRELFTDQDELLLAAICPIILTSIEDVALRGDLVDRSLIVTLPQVPDHRRLPEREFWNAFEGARPQIFGALLTAVAAAMRDEPSVHLRSFPRMADFALWATAAERGLGFASGAFMSAYTKSRSEANESILENSMVAIALRRLLQAGDFIGQPSELLAALNEVVSDETRRQKLWPKSPKGLHGQLVRLAPHLRVAGITVEFGRSTGAGSKRVVSIRQVVSGSVASVASVAGGMGLESGDPSHESVEMPPLSALGDDCDGCDGSKGMEDDLPDDGDHACPGELQGSATPDYDEPDALSVDLVKSALARAIEEGQQVASDDWESGL